MSRVNSVIVESRFDDTLRGNDHPNSFYSAEGDDVVTGADGDDFYTDGPGNDSFGGGEGSDAAGYFNSRRGIVADLAVGRVVGQGHDDLTSVEGLTGSGKGDEITGNQAHNLLTGLSGEDTIAGGRGNDVFVSGRDGDDMVVGGAGSDLVSFAGFSPFGMPRERVVADLRIGTASTGSSSDTLVNIESLEGTRFGDRVTGNEDANDLAGAEGGDVIRALGGDDRVFGDAGGDMLNGGTGNDFIYGGTGYDRCDDGESLLGCESGTGPTSSFGAMNTRRVGAAANTLQAVRGRLGLFLELLRLLRAIEQAR